MKDKAVVFGGSGFLGSHVADALTDEGIQVTIFDLKESPYLRGNQKMYRGDIMEPSEVLEVLQGADIVYHFAGVADIGQANEAPLMAVKHNILGTAIILDACVEAKVSRFVFSSSVYVYSEHGGFYRSTKQACELLIENYHKLYDLNFTILRFGSLYGRRADELNWIYSVIHQALTEGKMQRKGNGEEIRDYIHVQDAARACVSILLNWNYQNEYVILAGSQSIKVKDLLKMIKEMLGNEVTIEYLDERIEEHYEITPYTFRPRMAKKLFQETQIELGQGILDTIYDVYKKLKRPDDKKSIVSLPI